MTQQYDSAPETYKHILEVQLQLNRCIVDLIHRGRIHDQSKLLAPEKECFDAITPKLAGVTYGSEEYKATMREMKPAIEHHHKSNSHHPEFYDDGIRGMSLIDLIEMLCDWKAATLRHNDGSLIRSIDINQERFGYTDELKSILLRTAMQMQMF